MNHNLTSKNTKKLWIALVSVATFSFAFGQSNTLPNSGNVGIGTTSPTTKLQVNGSARIDSSLVVRDSVVFNKTARVKTDLRVDGKAILKGDVVIREGDFRIKPLGDTTLVGDGVLLINANGKVKNGGDLKSLIYNFPPLPQQLPCLTDANGNLVYSSPFWQAGQQKMFVLNNNCLPDVKVGIGVVPTAKLHIKTSNTFQTKPILVEDHKGNKLLQLNSDGLLYAREIKVNLDQAWPDYVFEKNYPLMPLNEVKSFIATNKHLPNVPSASEMQEQGINVAETNVLLMEKVEELTLYLIDLQEQLKKQQELLQKQQAIIDAIQQQKQ